MQFSSRHIVPATLSALALAISINAVAAPPAQSALTTDKDKVSYAIGMQIGTSVQNSLQQVKGEVDINTILRAINTTLTGGKPMMTAADEQTTLQAFGKRMQEKAQAQQQAMSQKNSTEGPAFLAANGKKPGVKTTASGLEYMVEKTGPGPKPKATDTVKVNYTGTLLDGTVFDASAQHGGPAIMQLNGVIPGWTEGVPLMNVGSKFVFWIPAKLGYGEKGSGPIGPNATLKFEVELISIGDK
jgi:FKBP-type peptidyl-prolyl cis-trans isomerase FkpA